MSRSRERQKENRKKGEKMDYSIPKIMLIDNVIKNQLSQQDKREIANLIDFKRRYKQSIK